MGLPLTVLEGAPFQDFLIPGLFLFTCLGVLPIIALFSFFTQQSRDPFTALNMYPGFRTGWMLSLICGFGTLIWITAQLYFIQTYHILQTVFALAGLLILILTLWPAMVQYCMAPRPSHSQL